MNFLDAEFVQEFIRMANDGWEQGWHERNGGNLSYRVKPEEVELIKENFKAKEWQPIGTSVPNLAGEFFLVTGSGKYFRNVIIKPEDSICMIELDEKGENYRIVWGLVNGGRPTSELPSHLMNLEVKNFKIQITAWSIMHIPPILLHSHLYFHSKIKCLRENCGRWQRSVRLFFRTVSVLFRGWFREEERSRLQQVN